LKGGWFFPSLLSLLWPGIGQLYNGSLRRALLFVFGAPLVTVLSLGLAVALPVPRLNVVPLLLIPAVWLAAILDATRDRELRRLQGV
jgi:hypothetical protein